MSLSNAARPSRIAGAGTLSLALLAGLACHPHEHPEPHDSHAEEQPREQLTLWSATHELFLEHAALVRGERADFAAHLTQLDTCAAVLEGRLHLRLVASDGSALEARSEAPARPGIFLLELTPGAAGLVRLEVELERGGARERFEAVERRVHADAASAKAAAGEEALGAIAFLKEQQWRLRTRVEAVDAGVLVERVAQPAQLRAARGKSAMLAAPIAGVVFAPAGAGELALGREVEAGELLLALRPPLSDFAQRLVEARAELERARAALELAKSAEARVRGLVELEARSARELEEASAALAEARAKHAAAEAVLGVYERSGLVLPEGAGGEALLPHLELRAPIAGRIESLDATLGEFAAEGRTLATILDARRLELLVRLRPELLARVDLEVPPLLRGPRSAGEGGALLETPPPRLVARSGALDPASGTLALVYELENPQGALPVGLALDVLLATSAAESAPIVPLSALVDLDGETVVYVQTGGESFEQRHVRLGARDGRRVQVLEGLAAGERVVVERPWMLRLAAASGSVPAHDHAH